MSTPVPAVSCTLTDLGVGAGGGVAGMNSVYGDSSALIPVKTGKRGGEQPRVNGEGAGLQGRRWKQRPVMKRRSPLSHPSLRSGMGHPLGVLQMSRRTRLAMFNA